LNSRQHDFPAKKPFEAMLKKLTPKLIAFSLFASSLSACFNVLKTKEKELATIEMPGENYSLKLVSHPSNATVERSIEVRKVFSNGKTQTIKEFEKYDIVATYKVVNNSLLTLVLRDTIASLRDKPDTMKINIVY
jgi:hypothetical protein